ncbi:MAG: PAS domain S-box protein [Deltaproteobacteria bacterium]|nr:PAS domain S-box protein [Deltaproteobacteria bacterium]
MQSTELQALTDALPDPIVVLDGDLAIQLWNQASESLLGPLEEALLGKSYRQLFPELLEKDLADAARVTTVAAGPSGPLMVQLSSCRTKIAHSQLVVIRFDRSSTRSAEHQIRALLERSPEAVLAHTEDLTILFANRAAAELYGVDHPMELVGRNAIEFAHPEELARVELARERAKDDLDSAERDFPEWRLVNARGEVSEVHARSVRIERDGQPLRLTFLRDISEEKQTRARLMVSERLASVGVLAAGVAHELRSPLAAIVGNLELATHRLEALSAKEDLSELMAEVTDAREAADRMREIVRDLSVFSRADEVPHPVDLIDALESSVRIAWHEIRGRARLVRDLGELHPAVGNEARLGQLFLNLLVNAAHAIPEGAPEAHEIRLTGRMSGHNTAIVSISDTGIGIDPANLSRIFTPFFTTKPAGVGTGLGLSICHRIVTTMGGTIECDSLPGRGTTFRVTLPTLARDAHVRPRVRSPEPLLPTGCRRRRLLVVDDELVIRSLVRRIFREDDVVECATIPLATELVTTGSFDAIICDLGMDGGGGAQLYRRLEAHSPELAKRLGFITGGSFPDSTRDLIEAKGILVVRKPFTPDELKRAVNRLSGAL